MIEQQLASRDQLILLTADSTVNCDAFDPIFRCKLLKPLILHRLYRALQPIGISHDRPVRARELAYAVPQTEVLQMLFNLFLAELPEHLQTIETALSANDFGKISFLAHRIHGTAGTARIDSLANHAKEIELLLKDQEIHDNLDVAKQRISEFVLFTKDFLHQHVT